MLLILVMSNVITVAHFRILKIMCKHFFAVIEGNRQTFNDISQLFRIVTLFG